MGRIAHTLAILTIAILCMAEAGSGLPNSIRRREFKRKKYDEATFHKTPIQPRDMPEYRLPTSLAPTHQLIQLQPYIYVGNFTYDGYTEITFDCLSSTSNITIHHRNLTIDQTLTTVEEDGGGTSIGIVSQTYDADKEFYIIALDQDLVAGQSYTLSITFIGNINDVYDDGPACFEEKYISQGGVDVYYFSSDFEPIDARACFPCFDEPAFKANFTTRLIREDHMLSASNGVLRSSTPLGNGWTMDEFGTTVIMSTYLNTFHVSDFSVVTGSDPDFSIYVRPGLENSTDYALFLGPALKNFFTNKFLVPNPMPKQDMVALTEFNLGGMENWGFITYSDYYLLYAEEFYTVTEKQSICEVVSHELAHQWFGNLITTEWWTNVWVQEGFASFYEYFGCGAVEPDFDEESVYLRSEFQYILEYDDKNTSNPLVYDIDHPDEIRGMFNTITYAKGSAMTRMMQYFLTVGTFDAAMVTYLRQYGFGNVNQDDLFEVLDTQAKNDGTLDPSLTVKQIMDTWTLQMGYPVVTVTRYENESALLTQERFWIDQAMDDGSGLTWYIPITYTTQSAPDFGNFNVFWLNQDEDRVMITNMPPLSEWVIFNIQAGGYFRVNYDEDSWNAIFTQLNTDHAIIDVRNRAQLINDAFNLALAGIVPYDIGFASCEYLQDETYFAPVDAALEEFGYIDGMLRRDSNYGPFKNYLFQLVQPIFDSVGFTDSISDPYPEQLLRELISPWACYLGYSPCTSEGTSLYSQWMASPNDHSIIGNNVRGVSYCVGVQEGTVVEWDFAYNRYLESYFEHEQERLLYAMGCTLENWLLTRYLEYAFNDSMSISKERVEIVIDTVSESTVGEDIAWDYLRTNDAEIASYMESSVYVAQYVLIISRKFNTDARMAQLQEYRDAFVAEFGSGNVGPIDLSIIQTQRNIDWMDDNYNEIITWLANNGY